jgi:hypothetical protein
MRNDLTRLANPGSRMIRVRISALFVSDATPAEEVPPSPWCRQSEYSGPKVTRLHTLKIYELILLHVAQTWLVETSVTAGSIGGNNTVLQQRYRSKRQTRGWERFS